MTSTNYAYTLQPVPYAVSEEEQRAAQLMMWRSSNKISTRTWLIIGVLSLLAILGLIFIQNYSTIFCWVILICLIIFIAVRIYGLEWYAKRKMREFPVQEIKGIRLGVQPHGMIMQQQMGMQQGMANIGWKDVSEWYDHPDFILMTFTAKGQQGSFFLPKRMDNKNFPFSTIRKHLKDSVGEPKKI
ncbi:SdpI family protein [Acinetobacter qingfengensis]|uniref:Uncharacterized protein n=1 Tax=Acinetobacter qingfengensis TaxID=1262585 RepID=A0A1E7RDL1_9GAMM|nr:SdpI family protein [Acinetobacter qingfengensis]KAA8734430.1 SdpI family protein [Acinetobacter qingfengensis]OEY97342.1 hypothetical protein BJI46_10140 [Acinetobacter qingfengensis]